MLGRRASDPPVVCSGVSATLSSSGGILGLPGAGFGQGGEGWLVLVAFGVASLALVGKGAGLGFTGAEGLRFWWKRLTASSGFLNPTKFTLRRVVKPGSRDIAGKGFFLNLLCK